LLALGAVALTESGGCGGGKSSSASSSCPKVPAHEVVRTCVPCEQFACLGRPDTCNQSPAAVLQQCPQECVYCGANTASTFDGNYTGSYTRQCTDGSGSAIVPLEFSVTGGSVVVSQPGQGSGSIDLSGTITMSAPYASGHVTLSFAGSVQASGQGGGQVTETAGHCGGAWTAGRR
jgi:hypothetical protein